MLIDRIDELCEKKKISKRTLEREAGLSFGSTSKWKTCNPNQTSLVKVANYFGVSVDYLTGASEEPVTEEMIQNIIKRRKSKYCEGLTETTAVQIPVLGKVVAGIPIEAVQEYLDFEEIPSEWTYIGQFFGLRVKGDSMSPRIQEGDTLIVRKQEDADSGDIVIAMTNNSTEATVKRLVKYEEGIRLIPFNPAYEPMDFRKNDDVKIIGKVVENRQRF